MTTISVDAIRAEAAKLDPLKLLITLIAAPLWLLGWTARIIWVVVSLLVGAAIVGWKAADLQIEARSAARGS